MAHAAKGEDNFFLLFVLQVNGFDNFLAGFPKNDGQISTFGSQGMYLASFFARSTLINVFPSLRLTGFASFA